MRCFKTHIVLLVAKLLGVEYSKRQAGLKMTRHLIGTAAEPAQNSLQPLTGYEVSCIMPDEMPVSFERNGGQGDMKILAPSTSHGPFREA